MKKFRVIKYLNVTKENLFKFGHGMEDEFETEIIFEEEFEHKKEAKVRYNEIKENGEFTNSLISFESLNGGKWLQHDSYTQVKK